MTSVLQDIATIVFVEAYAVFALVGVVSGLWYRIHQLERRIQAIEDERRK